MVNKQISVLVALIAAVISMSATMILATTVTASVEDSATPQCSQTELARAGALVTTNDLKKQCEAALNVTEMLRLEVEDIRKLCVTASCLVAFEQLYRNLPNCQYEDWPVKYAFKRLLMHCGVGPLELRAGSTAGDQVPSEESDSNQEFNDTSSSPASQEASAVGALITQVPARAIIPCPQIN
jgi:hypothetical protein